VVAKPDCLFHLLEPDADVGQAGDRKGAGDGAERHHEDVVVDVERVTCLGLDAHLLLGVRDGAHPAGDDVAFAQHPTERNDDVTGLQRAGRRLGQERLVRHVRARIDHCHPGLAFTQLLLQAERGVHADVSAAHDENVRNLVSIHLHCLPQQLIFEVGDAQETSSGSSAGSPQRRDPRRRRTCAYSTTFSRSRLASRAPLPAPSGCILGDQSI
jgi:hypothetical protein